MYRRASARFAAFTGCGMAKRLEAVLLKRMMLNRSRSVSRSIPSDALESLGSVQGTAFHSLQYPAEPLPFFANELACRDIERMAQRMRALDLVICVDTMTAHLAGALGCRTWVLLTERPDWRWLEDRDDSPWYPTLRLFRRCAGDWSALIDQVAGALDRERDRFIAARRIRSAGCRAS